MGALGVKPDAEGSSYWLASACCYSRKAGAFTGRGGAMKTECRDIPEEKPSRMQKAQDKTIRCASSNRIN
jgi:hypothetical protein